MTIDGIVCLDIHFVWLRGLQGLKRPLAPSCGCPWPKSPPAEAQVNVHSCHDFPNGPCDQQAQPSSGCFLDKTCMELAQSLGYRVFWFRLTNSALAWKSQITPPMHAHKGTSPAFLACTLTWQERFWLFWMYFCPLCKEWPDRNKIQNFKSPLHQWLTYSNIIHWCKYDLEPLGHPRGWKSFINVFYVHFLWSAIIGLENLSPSSLRL